MNIIIFLFIIIITVFLLIRAKKYSNNKKDYRFFLVKNILTLTITFTGIFAALYLNDRHRLKVERKQIVEMLLVSEKDIADSHDKIEQFVLDIYKKLEITDQTIRQKSKRLAANNYIAGCYNITTLPYPTIALNYFNDENFLKYMSNDFAINLYIYKQDLSYLQNYLKIFQDPSAMQVNDDIIYDISEVSLLELLIAYTIELRLFAYYCQLERRLINREISIKQHAKEFQEYDEKRARIIPNDKRNNIVIRVPLSPDLQEKLK